jgi:hypothetical protein
MIQETARQAGHADLIRERIDGGSETERHVTRTQRRPP